MGHPIHKNIRDEVLEAIDNGMVSKDFLLNAMLNWMSVDDVKEMLHANEINLGLIDEE